jgi:two-component system sensor histidine kinase PilS (NtrC family)
MNMPDSAWKRSWRSLLLFNGYRLVQMPLLVIMVSLVTDGVTRRLVNAENLIYLVGGIHVLLIALGLVFSWRWKKRFTTQLSLQVLIDVLFVNLLMFIVGGLSSGFGGVLLISVAGASMMVHVRHALFYAALACLFILSMETLEWVFNRSHDIAGFAQGGFLSLSFFVVAIVASLLGRRLGSNEDLARQRGEALENQVRISRRVMERMQDGVLVIDAEGRILQCNPMALAILGNNPDREKGDLSRIEPELARRYREWRDHNGSNRTEIHRPEGRDMTVRFVRTYSSDGVALVFLEDMSRMQEQALQLKLAALGRLTASIAHEIRNPLSAISHAGDLLAEELHNPVQERLLHIIHDNVLRLDRIIQDVLVLGRQRAMGLQPINLAVYLVEFIREIQIQERVDDQVIQLQVPEVAILYFEPGQLRQVLWNLVSNALRYASRTAGSVRLEVKVPEDGVELHILDDGPGVPNDLREQIFEPFFTTATKGTGLGLHIARELSEANGARLFIQNGTGGHFVLKGKGDLCQTQEMNEEPEAH